VTLECLPCTENCAECPQNYVKIKNLFQLFNCLLECPDGYNKSLVDTECVKNNLALNEIIIEKIKILTAMPNTNIHPNY